MQRCQQCGAKSWAPAAGTALRDIAFQSLAAMPGPKHDLNHIVICDGCGAWGLKSVIDSSPQPIELPPPFSSGPSPFALVADTFKNMMSAPESRLERLVKVIMRAVPCVSASGHVSGDEYAAWAVAMSRAIEKEMDREALLAGVPKPDAEFTDDPHTDIGTHR